MRRHKFIPAFAAIVTLYTCSLFQTASADTAPGVNLSAYNSFSFLNDTPGVLNQVMVVRIQHDVGSALSGKGYTESKPGDLTVVTSVGTLNRTRPKGWGWWGGQFDITHYPEGKLAVDVFDTKTRRPLWHSVGTETIDPMKPDPESINAAAASVMASFPARG
jgi:hypothetical protein